ncbi:hypothetical protein P43SY_002103 [Pythium insidiosum]|uniref:Peptidase M1 leukotriene A4 hydrolase/aminopeptidase C-terminal domain-containing protein n=1 Tax=Pythium insidiosum TaxID=114742 RepID=A0AAD5LPE5_PYTIN|nr:hypothetical protein P43SY_002103 [Pythium insidiosum]
MTTPASLEDPATCSALNEARLVHVALGMEVDMARRVITSVATLRMQRSVSCVELTTIQLDVLHLRIQGVQARAIEAAGTQVAASDDGTRVPLQWVIKPFTSFGEILSIQVPESLKTAEMLEIVVEYETSPSSPAVCWLDKEQTAGKTHPFVYTQGQEVLNRSFFPCQDSPSTGIDPGDCYNQCAYEKGYDFVCYLRSLVDSDEVLIKNHVESKLPYVQRFLTMQGKQKFQIPIYRLMVATEAGAVIHQFARDIYDLTRAALHVMVRDRIEALLATIADQ